MDFVLDASVTMAWCFEDEVTPYSEGVLDSLSEHRAVVPPLWRLEVANVLLAGERRRRLTRAKSESFFELLAQLPVHVANELRDGFASLMSFGRDHDLSAYDAAYLALAARLDLPLATQDATLQEAAKRAGVPPYSP